jgi:hypothetical protein
MTLKDFFLKLNKNALGLLGIVMLIMPFQPEPHLLQKYKMLVSGTLTDLIDIFDIFWHLLPLSLYVLRLYLEHSEKKPSN